MLVHAVLPQVERPVGDAQQDVREELRPLQREHRPEGLRDRVHLLAVLGFPVLLDPGGPVPEDELALLGGGEKVGQLPIALVVVSVPAVQDVAAAHLSPAVLPLQLDFVHGLPDEVVIVDAVHQGVEVPDQDLAVPGDRQEVLHRRVPGDLPLRNPATLLDLQLRGEEVDPEDRLLVGLVDHRDLLVRDGRGGRALLLVGAPALGLLPKSIPKVRIGELPHRELSTAHPTDEVLLIAWIELEGCDLPRRGEYGVGDEGVLEGPNENGADGGLPLALDALAEGQVLAARASDHVGGVRNPLDPLYALVLHVGHIVEITVLLDVGVRLRNCASLLVAQVLELLLEDVDRLVRLKRLLDAVAYCGEELGELVDLAVDLVALKEVIG
mmetsp:Transcript_112315/g.349975  ORF Transcript_112315/g.349975 Transcript_112315/m.349975 type:complete len:383 (-) Transcript_112315:1266-2414(-)